MSPQTEATTSRSPSVALANSEDPLFRFKGVIKGVLVERPDGTADCAFYNPKRNCFSVINRTTKGYVRAQIVGGPDCGTVFFIGPEWDNNDAWEQMCEWVNGK